MKPNEVKKLVKTIWDYHHMSHRLEKADLIIVMGSSDTQVAVRAAKVFKESWAPLVITTGGFGRISKKKWDKPEAEVFAEIMVKHGVPSEKILVENKSSNTSENIEFARNVLRNGGVKVRKVILIHKPYGERRAYATFRKVWPGPKVIVTSPQLSFEKYKREGVSKEEMIHIVVGDLQRIKEYSKKGFQISQKIPKSVWNAYKNLVSAGYTRHLIKPPKNEN